MFITCPHCRPEQSTEPSTGQSLRVVRFGHFRRRSDSRVIQRFRCLECRRTFSRATFHPCYRQKKRHMNFKVFKQLTAHVSLRRTAEILNLNRKTVVRKLIFLASRAELELEEMNRSAKPAECVEFDDLETIEHTKCKPLSVITMVEQGTRRILGFEVAQMPAKGKLAAISVKKYGQRVDHRPQARKKLFERLKPFVNERAVMKFDMSFHYPADVKRYFPHCEYQTFKGRRACVAGQGELKVGGFDPIFSINHTFASARANVNRLIRRTWCTTKRPDRLRAHLMLYVVYHNRKIRKRRSRAG